MHAVQGLRRDAGFEIADRIALAVDGPDLPDLLSAHGGAIAGEVLAETLQAGRLDEPEARGQLKIGSSVYAIELARLSRN